MGTRLKNLAGTVISELNHRPTHTDDTIGTVTVLLLRALVHP